MTKELTDKELEQRQEAAKTHGIYAFRDRGEDALDTEKLSVYRQLRDQFQTAPGRAEYRVDLAAFLAMMIELAKGDIRDRADKGRPIWDSPPIGKMGCYINALMRLMDNWPKDQKKNENIVDLMKGNQDENDQ